jgi:tetratricopeptide (TPR) repeat protein
VLFALSASAQYIPPIPKSVSGTRALHRTGDIPLPPANERWVRARSRHFLTISGAPSWRTRQVVSELETVASALREVDPHFAAGAAPTRMILFPRSRDAAPYLDLLVGNRTAGAFVVSPGGDGTMLIDGSRPFADRTVFHELVHNLLANSGTHVPLWLEEGLADFYSTAEVNGNIVKLGRPGSDRFSVLIGRGMMPMEDFFAVKPGSETATDVRFYAQAWAVVDWMMRLNRTEFFAFVSSVEHGMSAPDALRKHFHVDVSAMQHSLQTSTLRPPAMMTIRLPARPEPPETQPLEHDDVLLELAAFLGSFGATRPDAVRFALAVTQPNARALAALGSMRARDKRYDEAWKLYEDALKIDPAEVQIRLAFAESLLRNALGPFTGTMDVEKSEAPRFLKARQLATEALAAGGDSARANAVIGSSYLVEEDVTPGIEALRRARAADPNRYDVALNLYALLLRNGQHDDADALFQQIQATARTPQATFAARAVAVREQLALANRLLNQARTDDAIVIVQQLRDATGDPVAKADLDGQLARLRELAETNRQIIAYNEAIRVANTGDARKAMDMIDHLLETATDPGVVADAMTFRKVLEKRMKRPAARR